MDSIFFNSIIQNKLLTACIPSTHAAARGPLTRSPPELPITTWASQLCLSGSTPGFCPIVDFSLLWCAMIGYHWILDEK